MDVQDLRIGIQNTVLASSDVEDLIEVRFYPAELAEVTNPEYPCVNAPVSRL